MTTAEHTASFVLYFERSAAHWGISTWTPSFWSSRWHSRTAGVAGAAGTGEGSGAGLDCALGPWGIDLTVGLGAFAAARAPGAS